MIDASLAQLVTDENEVFVREGDTTLLMLGSRVRAPEGVQSKRLIINDYRSFCLLVLCVTDVRLVAYFHQKTVVWRL